EKNNLILSTAIFFSPTFIQHPAIGDPLIYLNIFAVAKKKINYKYTLSPKYLMRLEEYIDQLINEAQSQHEDREHALLLWLHLILLTIHRNSQQKSTHQGKESKHGPEWLEDALTYINQHI